MCWTIRFQAQQQLEAAGGGPTPSIHQFHQLFLNDVAREAGLPFVQLAD
jgi:hypothetical protein